MGEGEEEAENDDDYIWAKRTLQIGHVGFQHLAPSVLLLSQSILPQSSDVDIISLMVTGVRRHPGTETTQSSGNPDLLA